MATSVDPSSFTPRELRIIEAVATGAGSHKDVAERLGLSVATVEQYVSQLAKRVPGIGRPMVKLARFWSNHVAPPRLPRESEDDE